MHPVHNDLHWTGPCPTSVAPGITRIPSLTEPRDPIPLVPSDDEEEEDEEDQPDEEEPEPLPEMATGFTDQQKQELANLIAAAFLAQGQQATPKDTKIEVAKPCEYSGGVDYEDFKHEVVVYIAACPGRFPDNKTKILFVLSYLRGGHASS